jgi:hypothetical protein
MSAASGRAITVDEVTPEWLTAILRREGALPSGRVVAFEQQPNTAFNSHTRHLAPIYEGQGTDIAPKYLLLKCSLQAAWAQQAGAREVAFYQMVKRMPDHPPIIVRCYDAVIDGESGNSHLLLDDLSDSHIIAVARDRQITFVDHLPTESHLQQTVEALARFHAYWWEHPLLGSNSVPLAWGCAAIEQYDIEIGRRRRALDHLFAQEGEWLPNSVKELFERMHAQLFPIWRVYMQQRVATRSQLTLTHGDAYLANFLCPREGQEGATYIIDWQSPECYRGPTDLVNLCATFWTQADRAEGEREMNVLRRYLAVLHKNGVRGYAWEDLVRDYRLSILDWLWVPVQDCYDGSGKSYWWPKLQCLLAAYEDWHCERLLEANA